MIDAIHSSRKLSGGRKALWIVANDHNARHLNNRRMLWWHLSGASLIVWLSRHWTPEQVLARAFEIESKKASVHHDPSRPSTTDPTEDAWLLVE